MATEWEGKSRGTVLGYRIFVFIIKNLGLGTAYLLLHPVVFYFCFFSGKGTRAIYGYQTQILGRSWVRAFFGVYQSYYVFGQTLIDRVAISGGLRDRFTYVFDGVEKIEALLKQGKGGILISAHVGNFEIADFFFDELSPGSRIQLVTTDAEHRQIKEYMERVTSKSNIGFILVRDDMSHIFEIKAALDQGALVCFTGDRYFEGQKTMRHPFMGPMASFPAGPFLLASRLQVPVLFVYVMKETRSHYHLYAREARSGHRDAQGLLGEYTGSVEGILRKYPLQWFNYFNFWKAEV